MPRYICRRCVLLRNRRPAFQDSVTKDGKMNCVKAHLRVVVLKEEIKIQPV
jgi:hypothetical protein